MDPDVMSGPGVFSKDNSEHEITYMMCRLSRILEKPLGVVGGVFAEMHLSKLQKLAGPQTPMFSEWCEYMAAQLKLSVIIDNAIPVPISLDPLGILESDTYTTKTKRFEVYPRESYGPYYQEIPNHFSYYDKLKLDLSDTEATIDPGYQSIFEKLFNKPETPTGVIKSLTVVKK